MRRILQTRWAVGISSWLPASGDLMRSRSFSLGVERQVWYVKRNGGIGIERAERTLLRYSISAESCCAPRSVMWWIPLSCSMKSAVAPSVTCKIWMKLREKKSSSNFSVTFRMIQLLRWVEVLTNLTNINYLKPQDKHFKALECKAWYGLIYKCPDVLCACFSKYTINIILQTSSG